MNTAIFAMYTTISSIGFWKYFLYNEIDKSNGFKKERNKPYGNDIEMVWIQI